MNRGLLPAVLFSFVMVTGREAAMAGSLDIQALDKTHDSQLSAWGPYSKKYAGISHLPDLASGMRFDLSVLPGYYRSGVLIPNVLFESGYYPWQANSDLKRVTYRYELEWKDKLFVDAAYSLVDTNAVLLEMKCVNNAALPQNIVLNLMASLNYPETYSKVTAKYPADTKWVNAINYQQLTFARPRPTDNLVYDGWRRGEARGDDYLDGSAIAKGFGKDRGDSVSFSLASCPSVGLVSFRFRVKNSDQVTFKLSGLVSTTMTVRGTGQFEVVSIPFTNAPGGNINFTLESAGGNEIELNGFFIGPGISVGDVKISRSEKRFVPELDQFGSRSVILKYPDVEKYYGLAWDYAPSIVREFLNDDLDVYFRKLLQDHVNTRFVGNQEGHFTDVFLRPVELDPHSDRTVRALICCGRREDVKETLASFNSSPGTFVSNAVPEESFPQDILPEGEKYTFSQRMMRACTLANVVYPIYTQQGYIRHFTPGKWWNSLYTWDDGFIALGLAEINPELAFQCLNTYTTSPGSQSAFVHHGSMVPVQMYAFLELVNKTTSREALEYFYPRLKQYYEFYAGRGGSSTTRSLRSNLLKTWDYFYNSGGWDDYPPQKAVHDQHMEKNVTPVITTAQCIRAAKILRMAAEALSLTNDIAGYDQDIQVFSDALQINSWDQASGYFSYVVHDDTGRAISHFKDDKSGLNYNMGLDGAYPLMSGICTPEQQDVLLGKVFSTTNMWTPSGICVVDQSAPYYRTDGYWNGAVWMPHQWFMWKTMLDLGRPDLARKIAQRALDVWKDETDESYHTFEHFFAKSGRGAGWHQFSGLSTPVLSWFSAYFRPGTVTAGFEVMIRKQSFDSEKSSYQADLTFDHATTPHQRSLLLCLNPAHVYEVVFNGEKLKPTSPYRGLLEIMLPGTNAGGWLSVRPTRG